ncbi:hypothetical protein FHG87_020773 [Trinorchestia longiramus]|nr:hypothetical protein FHG87_020773 [Trinorchestia longiramus]
MWNGVSGSLRTAASASRSSTSTWTDWMTWRWAVHITARTGELSSSSSRGKLGQVMRWNENMTSALTKRTTGA